MLPSPASVEVGSNTRDYLRHRPVPSLNKGRLVVAKQVIKIEIAGEDVTPEVYLGKLAQSVGEVAGRIKRIKTTLAQPLGKIIKQQVQARFLNAGIGPGDLPSDRWDELSRAAIGIRQARGTWPGRGGSQPIRRETLRDQRSFSLSFGTGGSIFRYGSKLPSALVHEFGGVIAEDIFIRSIVDGKERLSKIPAGTIVPARPVLDSNSFILQQMTDTILDYVLHRFDRLGEVGESIIRDFGDR